MEGWIKLYRKLSEKGFYKKDSEKVHLWIHLLIKSTHFGKEEMLAGKKYYCNPGQFTTGRKQLSEETGISESKIERILTYFEKLEQQIEQQKTNTNRLITIINWKDYQPCEQQIEQQLNNERTTTEQQLDTLRECNNDNNEKKYIYSDFYDIEIETNKENPEIESYQSFVRFIFGENQLKVPLSNWLTLKTQITFKQYIVLLKKAKEKKRKIAEMLYSGQNDKKYTKGKVSIYLTLNNWLNRD